jgi:holliday junction DNA helicase RuvA
MIARLFGTVLEKGIDHVIVDAGGVGYRVFASVGTLAALPAPGGEVRLRIHTHVAETAFDLYGFADVLEEQVFHCLIDAPNIGCKKALQILSGLPAEEIVAAVRAGDAGRLSKAHGVGKKTAERLVVELRDRIATLPVGLKEVGGEGEAAPAGGTLLDHVTSGLVGLGYKPDAAEAAAEAALADLGGEDLPALLRDALQRLRKG